MFRRVARLSRGDGSPARQRRRAFASGVLCGVVLLLGIRLIVNETSLADWMVKPLLVRDSQGRADAIVVPGAGVTGPCVPNLHALRRTLLASRLWREGRAPLILFTGGTGSAGCPVAKAMADLAIEVGVPASSVHIETSSLSTRENGELSAPLLRGWGVRSIVIVTDHLHMRRASGAFENHGFRVERASVPVYAGHLDNVSMLQAGSREMAALLYYRMRGWLGIQSAGHWQTGEAENRMTVEVRYQDGPVVILGASYAGGWSLESVGGRPVVNRGVSGEQSFEMLARFERDVLAARPRAVIIWGFINDLFRAGPGATAQTAKRVRESYRRMVAGARQHGVEPVLATELTARPPATWSETFAGWVGAMTGKQSYQDRINEDVIALNEWFVDFASDEGLLVLDLQAVLAEPGGRRRRQFAQPDGSHITPAGYAALTAYARPILEKRLAGSRNSR